MLCQVQFVNCKIFSLISFFFLKCWSSHSKTLLVGKMHQCVKACCIIIKNFFISEITPSREGVNTQVASRCFVLVLCNIIVFRVYSLQEIDFVCLAVIPCITTFVVRPYLREGR